jgi:putative transcriptional regulator
MPNPTKTEIRHARKQAGLTQSQAAELVHASLGGWRKWESGAREMHAAFWELFLIKINLKTPL